VGLAKRLPGLRSALSVRCELEVAFEVRRGRLGVVQVASEDPSEQEVRLRRVRSDVEDGFELLSRALRVPEAEVDGSDQVAQRPGVWMPLQVGGSVPERGLKAGRGEARLNERRQHLVFRIALLPGRDEVLLGPHMVASLSEGDSGPKELLGRNRGDRVAGGRLLGGGWRAARDGAEEASEA
jgi:hypothetical protein